VQLNENNFEVRVINVIKFKVCVVKCEWVGTKIWDGAKYVMRNFVKVQHFWGGGGAKVWSGKKFGQVVHKCLTVDKSGKILDRFTTSACDGNHSVQN